MDDAKQGPGRGDGGGQPLGKGWLGRLRRGGKAALEARSLEGRAFSAPGMPVATTLRGGEPVCLDPRGPIRAGYPSGAAVVGALGSGKRTILESVVGCLRAGERGVVLTEAGEGERWQEAVPFEVEVVPVGVGSRPRLVPASGLTPGPAGGVQEEALVDLFAAALGTSDHLERHALLLAVRELLDPADFLFDGLGDVAWAYRLVAGLDALRRRSERGSELRRAAARLARSVCREAEDPLASIVLGTPPGTDEIEESLSVRATDGPRLVVVEVCLASPVDEGWPLEKLSDERRISATLWPLLLLRVLDHLFAPHRSGEDPDPGKPFSLLVLPETRHLLRTLGGYRALDSAVREAHLDRTAVWLGAERSGQLESLSPLLTTRFLGREAGARGRESTTTEALRDAGFAAPEELARRLSLLGPGEFLHANHLGEAGFVRLGRPAGVGTAGNG